MRSKEGLEAAPYLGKVHGELGTGALPFAEQLCRNVRTRLVAASTVVLVHAAYPPGHAVLASVTPRVAAAEALAFRVLVSFPVDAFILLAFLGLAPRVQAGARAGQLLRTSSRRLLPAHVFWALAFLGVKAALHHELPSPRTLLEGIVLGQAAAHLYFIPQLLALTAVAPILDRCARTPVLAVTVGGALAFGSLALENSLGLSSAWVHSLVGFLGLAPFALAGLALARSWQGTAPSSQRSLLLLTVGGAVALASVGLLARACIEAPPGPVTLTPAGWLGNYGCALAVPLLLLSLRVPTRSPWQMRVVPYTFGVYLVHPFFLQAMRAAEARVGALATHPLALVLPNAAVTTALSVATIALLARSPFRRVVT